MAWLRPHLLAGDDPAVAVALGPGGEPGQVGAGARLAEQLAPGDPALEDRRDEAVRSARGCRGRGSSAPPSSSPRPPGGRRAPWSANAGAHDRLRRGGRGRGRPARGRSAARSSPRRRRSSTSRRRVRSGSQCSSSQAVDLVPQRRRGAASLAGVAARRSRRGARAARRQLSRMIRCTAALVEAGELLGEVERLGDALAVGPVGAEQDALDADQVGQRARGPPRGTA